MALFELRRDYYAIPGNTWRLIMFNKKAYYKTYNIKNATRIKLQAHLYYLRVKEKKLKLKRSYQEPLLRFVEQQKKKPCLDCKLSYPTCMMQFDHRPGTQKIESISHLSR